MKRRVAVVGVGQTAFARGRPELANSIAAFTY